MSNKPIREQAKDMASLFRMVVAGLTNKKLWERYHEQTTEFDNFRREIKEHREAVAELNRRKSVAKMGVDIIETELKKRKIYYE